MTDRPSEKTMSDLLWAARMGRQAGRSLRDIYYIIFRHKGKALLFFFTVTILAIFWASLSPEIYRSQATLLLRVNQNNLSPEASPSDARIISAGRSPESQVNSELEILKTYALAEKVVDAIGPWRFLESPNEPSATNTSIYATLGNAVSDFCQRAYGALHKSTRLLERLGLRKPLDARQRALATFMKNLGVSVPGESNIISVSYVAQSPALAQEVLDKLIEFYLEKHIVLHRGFDPREFFVHKADEAHLALAKTEQELRDCKDSLGIVSVYEEKNILLAHIGALRQETDLTEVALCACQAKVEKLRHHQIAHTQVSPNEENPAPNPATHQPISSPQEIDSLLVKEAATLSSLQAKTRALREKEAEALKALNRLQASELQIAQLERKLNNQEASYCQYLERLEKARIACALDRGNIPNVAIVQPATYPFKPAGPRRVLWLILGLSIGIFGGVAMTFFAQRLDHSLKTPEDVEKHLRLPTLAAIPYVNARSRSAKMKSEG
jgi:uncharacterized protein involved in exopolysaccharide biosynthesis